MDPDTFGALVRHYEGGNSYTNGFGSTASNPIDLSNAPLDQNGFPIWEGRMGPQGNSRAAGAYQFEPGTWAPYAQKLGITDFSPASQDAVFQAAYADQGGKPWLPYNSKLRAAYNATLAGNMLPFGNSRFGASLMPQTGQLGSSIMGSQAPLLAGAGGGTSPDAALDPLTVMAMANGPGAVGMPSSSGPDPMADLMTQLKNGGALNSQTLAQMAAGFLGGKGPAQSLAGGFGGLAKGQSDDVSEMSRLAQAAMIYGPMGQAKLANAQAEIKQKAITNAAALSRTGATGLGTALRMNGQDPEALTGQTEQQLNDQTFADKPLAAGTQKMVDGHTAAIATIRSNRATLDGIQQQIQNGTFVPDALHMNVLYPLQAGAGNPTGDPGVVAYQQWKSASSSLANDILNSAKGVQTDSDRKAAMDVLSGGGLTSVDQANAHINFLQNKGALVEQEHKFAVDQEYKNAKKGAFPWDAFEQTIPAAPAASSAKDIGGSMYAPHNVGQPSANGAPTPVASPATSGVTPGGVKWSLVPQ